MEWVALAEITHAEDLVYNFWKMGKNHPILVEIGQGLSLMLGLPTLQFWDSYARPKNAKRGTFGFNIETKSLEYFDGSSWFGTPALVEV